MKAHAPSTTTSVAAQVAGLPHLSMDDLWKLWDEHFDERPGHHHRGWLESRCSGQRAASCLREQGFVRLSAAALAGGGLALGVQLSPAAWAFAIAPTHPLAFMPEPISESQLRLYPNIMVEDTAHTINKKVGWLLHGQEAILVPDFNTKCQCQILGEGIGFLPEYMVREAVDAGLLVTRRINNPRQDSRMLLATQHAATGQVTLTQFFDQVMGAERLTVVGEVGYSHVSNLNVNELPSQKPTIS